MGARKYVPSTMATWWTIFTHRTLEDQMFVLNKMQKKILFLLGSHKRKNEWMTWSSLATLLAAWAPHARKTTPWLNPVPPGASGLERFAPPYLSTIWITQSVNFSHPLSAWEFELPCRTVKHVLSIKTPFSAQVERFLGEQWVTVCKNG